MRRFTPLLLVALLDGPASAQVPQSADLWRVAAAVLPQPPALQAGPTASIWNPAAADHGRLSSGVQVIQTSDVLELSGVLVGVTRQAGAVHLGLVVGRMEVGDLIRTTTSPDSEEGSVPVYEQLAGFTARLGDGPVRIGGQVRVHDSRFDAARAQGVTADVGIVLTPVPRLRMAAATHFLPLDLSSRPSTDYYFGAEYELSSGLDLAGAQGTLIARYGGTYRTSGDLEHAFGLGMLLDPHLALDAGVIGESAYGMRSWRPVVGVALRVGRYAIGVARSQGLNDVGATYRVGLDVELMR